MQGLPSLRVILEIMIILIGGKTFVGYLLTECTKQTGSAGFIDFTVDRSTYEHGKFPPRTHVPILTPERLRDSCRGIVISGRGIGEERSASAQIRT